MKKVLCKFSRFRKTVFRCLSGVIFLSLMSCGGDDSSNPHDKPHNPNQAVEVKFVSPVSGGIGTKVIVAGSNFGNDTTGVQLYFNSKKALIMNIQDNAIYALVPFQPGEFSNIKVVIKGKEAVLDGMQFQYFIRSTVTTVSGQYGVATSVDGPALQATYARPVSVAVKRDGSLMFIVDDNGGRVRMLSPTDNMVTTVIDGLVRPWTIVFNTAEDHVFIGERETSARPILFYSLSEKTNWTQREIYYDQRDENGNFIAGEMPMSCLTADDTYVYIFSGTKLVRVHQTTKKVEAISGPLIAANWTYPVFNPVNRMLYLVCEDLGRVYWLDPYHTPEGRTSPWITVDDMEWIAGMGRGSAIEGNGRNFRFGVTECPCFDGFGNLYIPDDTYHLIFKLDMDLNGTVIAGIVGRAGYLDGTPQEALLNRPYGVAATDDGRIYVVEAGNYLVRCIAIQ